MIFPHAGITKAQLADYYRRIGREMLPHVRGRPLVVETFPHGIEAEGLRWSQPPEWFPEWVERFRAGREAGAAIHVMCNRVTTLVFLVENGMVTPHAWPSRIERPARPDRMVFDINPADGSPFDMVRDAAEALRIVLGRLNLAAFAMTTGSRGIHVIVPLTGRDGFDTVRRFARDVVEMAAAEAPERILPPSDSGSVAEDSGKRVTIGLDPNNFGRSSVAPYAVRGRANAPVATPFAWEDLRSVEPGQFTIESIFGHLAGREDPWRDMKRLARSLSRARKPL